MVLFETFGNHSSSKFTPIHQTSNNEFNEDKLSTDKVVEIAVGVIANASENK